MVIPLGPGRKGKAQKGRNFAWAKGAEHEFGYGLQQIKQRQLDARQKVLTKRTIKFIAARVRRLKEEYRKSKHPNWRALKENALFEIDSFVVSNLRLPEKTEKRALKELRHGAKLFVLQTDSIKGRMASIAEGRELLKKALASLNELEPERRRFFDGTGITDYLKRINARMENATSGAVIITTPLAASMALIQGNLVRQILGDEAGELYNRTYDQVQHLLAKLMEIE